MTSDRDRSIAQDMRERQLAAQHNQLSQDEVLAQLDILKTGLSKPPPFLARVTSGRARATDDVIWEGKKAAEETRVAFMKGLRNAVGVIVAHRVGQITSQAQAALVSQLEAELNELQEQYADLYVAVVERYLGIAARLQGMSDLAPDKLQLLVDKFWDESLEFHEDRRKRFKAKTEELTTAMSTLGDRLLKASAAPS
jgi:hypothetical protein